MWTTKRGGVKRDLCVCVCVRVIMADPSGQPDRTSEETFRSARQGGILTRGVGRSQSTPKVLGAFQL